MEPDVISFSAAISQVKVSKGLLPDVIRFRASTTMCEKGVQIRACSLM